MPKVVASEIGRGGRVTGEESQPRGGAKARSIWKKVKDEVQEEGKPTEGASEPILYPGTPSKRPSKFVHEMRMEESRTAY